jgi:hypothetical protein
MYGLIFWGGGTESVSIFKLQKRATNNQYCKEILYAGTL